MSRVVAAHRSGQRRFRGHHSSTSFRVSTGAEVYCRALQPVEISFREHAYSPLDCRAAIAQPRRREARVARQLPGIASPPSATAPAACVAQSAPSAVISPPRQRPQRRTRLIVPLAPPSSRFRLEAASRRPPPPPVVGFTPASSIVSPMMTRRSHSSSITVIENGADFTAHALSQSSDYEEAHIAITSPASLSFAGARLRANRPADGL